MIGRIEETDIEPGSFDIITSTSALEHVARPLEHVRRILELLKPGGIAYFTMPNFGSLPIRLCLVKGRLVLPPCHCNYFTSGTLRNLFRLPGLKDLVTRVHVRSYGIPEIHGLYQRLPRRKARSAPTGQSKPSQRRRLKTALVHIYYWSGAPFGLGDKLEATVTRRTPG